MRLRLNSASTLIGLLALCVAIGLRAQPPQSSGGASETAPMCPLSEEQTQKSIKAFAELAPIFHEPRCQNCHGVVNPFFAPETHGADPPIEPGSDCESCHDELKGWSLAPTSMSFVDKSDEDLCEMMKEHFKKATGEPSFIEHMKHDNGGPQFIETAFLGKKGMSDPDSVDPPSNRGWNHGKLIRLSEDWVDAMGGRFHGDASCGCKPQHYAMRLDYNVILNLQGLPVIGGEYQTQTVGQNSNSLDIPLEAKSPGYFEGQAVMNLQGNGLITTPVGNCTGQAQHSFLVHVTAQMDEGDEESRGAQNKLHVKMDCSQMHTTTSAQCPRLGASESNSSPCEPENVDVDFVPADLDKPQGKAFPVPLPDSQATLTSTIVKTD